MEQQNLFPETVRAATDEEVMAAFRIALSRGGRLNRMADLYLASVCAEHLVDQLHIAGLRVVKDTPVRWCE
jgi:hypothetical protein